MKLDLEKVLEGPPVFDDNKECVKYFRHIRWQTAIRGLRVLFWITISWAGFLVIYPMLPSPTPFLKACKAIAIITVWNATISYIGYIVFFIALCLLNWNRAVHENLKLDDHFLYASPSPTGKLGSQDYRFTQAHLYFGIVLGLAAILISAWINIATFYTLVFDSLV